MKVHHEALVGTEQEVEGHWPGWQTNRVLQQLRQKPQNADK